MFLWTNQKGAPKVLIMKKAISATVDGVVVKEIDNLLQESSLFRNRSHVIEVALKEYLAKNDHGSENNSAK